MEVAIRLNKNHSPDVRLGVAVSEFEVLLVEDQKRLFRTQRQQEVTPSERDVERITALIDAESSKNWPAIGRSGKSLGGRFATFLSSIQQYLSVVDVIVGGSQCLPVCGVWGAVRFTLQAAAVKSSCFEEISLLMLEINKTLELHSDIQSLFSWSKAVQSALCDYLVSVVDLCKKLIVFLGFSSVRQTLISNSLSSQCQVEKEKLARYSRHIFDLSLLASDKQSWELTNKVHDTLTNTDHQKRERREFKARSRFLKACSTFSYEKAKKQARKEGNPRWFLNEDAYKSFKESPGLLWCLGKLGSGKTVLTASIIDDLLLSKETETIVAYHFCSHDEPQSLLSTAIIRSLSKQLLMHASQISSEARKVLTKAATSSERLGRAYELDTSTILEVVARLPPTRLASSFLLVDGIHECSKDQMRELLGILRRLWDVTDSSFHVYVSSRPDSLTHVFAAWKPDQLIDTSMAPTTEMHNYITETLDRYESVGDLPIVSPTVRQKIEEALMAKASGMYLWTRFMIHELSSQKSDAALLKALTKLPKDLSTVFNRILLRLHDSCAEADIALRKTFFQIVAGVRRPLTVSEMQEAASIDPRYSTWVEENWISDIERSLSCAGCLLSVDEEDQTIHFAHSTIKEHLFALSTDFPHNNALVSNYGLEAKQIMWNTAEVVMTYLNYNGKFDQDIVHTGKGPISQSTDYVGVILQDIPKSQRPIIKLEMRRQRYLKKLKERISIDSQYSTALQHMTADKPHTAEEAFPFLAYAREFWFIHGKAFALRPKHSEESFEFLYTGNVSMIKQPWAPEDHLELGPKQIQLIIDTRHWYLLHPIVHAYLERLHPIKDSTVLHILQSLPNLDPPYNTRQIFSGMLYHASSRNEGKIIELLLEKGADVDVEESQSTALEKACSDGSDLAVSILLKGGADANKSGGLWDGPLLAAVHGGHVTTVKLLAASSRVSGHQVMAALEMAKYQMISEDVRSTLAKLYNHGKNILTNDTGS